MPSEKAMKIGSPCPPPPEPGKLRLYSMRFCPYAQRTRLVLAAKGIEYETINIHLKEKPDWFLEKTPVAKVPVLEKDGELVFESQICNEYLDVLYPDKCITPSDPREKARQGMLLAVWDAKVVASYYKLGTAKDEECPAITKQLMDGIQYMEKSLSQPFFGGNTPGALDYNIWPWAERFFLLKGRGVDLSMENVPKLTAWMERMMKQPEVMECSFPREVHEQYYKLLMEGDTDRYDLGLEE